MREGCRFRKIWGASGGLNWTVLYFINILRGIVNEVTLANKLAEHSKIKGVVHYRKTNIDGQNVWWIPSRFNGVDVVVTGTGRPSARVSALEDRQKDVRDVASGVKDRCAHINKTCVFSV